MDNDPSTAIDNYGGNDVAVGPPSEAQAAGVAQSFANDFSVYDAGPADAATGSAPSATGSSALVNGYSSPEAEAAASARRGDESVAAAGGFDGALSNVGQSLSDASNTIVNTILGLAALASGNPLAALKGGQTIVNTYQSGAYGRFGSAPSFASSAKGATTAANNFSTGSPTAERGDSGGGLSGSQVIGWQGVTVNRVIDSAPVAATPLPNIAAFKPQSNRIGLVNAPGAAATSSSNQAGSTVSPGVLVVVGLGILLLA